MPIAFSLSGMDPYSYREYLFNPMNRFTRDQIAYGMASLMNGVNNTRGVETAPRAETPEEKQYKQLLSQFFQLDYIIVIQYRR